jgi:hypothetical protein
MTTLAGRCGCGAVRYQLRTPPMFVNCCHCTDCQRETGSGFVLNAIIETERIERVAGTPIPIATPTASGRPHDLHRCPTCQVAVWSDYGRRPTVRSVRVGTLETPGALPPMAHIFVRSKLPWLTLPADGAPRFDVYYDLRTLWPADSLARRRAILGDP